MIIKKLKKVSISEILILILLVIILLQKCGGTPENPTEPQITRDTVWVHTDSTILSKPQIIKTIPYTVPIDRWNTEYLPDTSSMAILIKQYEALVRELLAKNIHTDSIKIDSIGHVYIIDTVSKNNIVSRSTHYDLHYPIITNTITILEKKRQLYLGLGVGGTQQDLINKMNIGLLYKNKQDFMFGPNVSIQQNGNVSYGIQAFWKIKLHK